MDKDGRKQAESRNPDNIIAGTAAAISVSRIINNEVNFKKGILRKGGMFHLFLVFLHRCVVPRSLCIFVCMLVSPYVPHL